MPRIFLSYRRTDSTAFTRQLYEVLAQEFGPESVFYDLHSIPPGQTFSAFISTRLKQADLLIAVIGNHWLARDATGRARVAAETDFVRQEICAALDNRIPLLVLLVGNAALPSKVEVPECMHQLLEYNVARVDDGRDFHIHAKRLVKDIERLLESNSSRHIMLTNVPPTAQSTDGVARGGWVRPSAVLLDRHYSYALASYCADKTPGKKPADMPKYSELFKILSNATLFFDRIFIEQSYVSSIAWALNRGDSEAFMQMFQSFTFDSLKMSAQDRSLLIETIEADLADNNFRREIDLYYEGRVLKSDDYRELVGYINKAIFASHRNNWTILPWPRRVPLYSYKLSKLNRYWNPLHALDSVQRTIDIVVPSFNPESLTELEALRGDPKILAFRDKMWELTVSAGTKNSMEPGSLIMQEFRQATRELSAALHGRLTRSVSIAGSVSSPLPISPKLALPEETEEAIRRQPFAWLFFLYDATDEQR